MEIDRRDEKIGYKIREAQLKKIPYMLILGENESAEGTISVRSRDKGDLGSAQLADFIENITENIEDLAAEKKKTAKDADKKENLSVPAKVNYMKMARGGVSQACSALKKTGGCEDLLDILKDVKSEMVIRQK